MAGRTFESAIAKTAHTHRRNIQVVAAASPRPVPGVLGANKPFLQKRVARARDLTRRLGGALAAQRAVSDRSGMSLAACKERRRMELTLGHHGAILDFEAAELCADIPFDARITLRCPWILAGAIPCLWSVALGPLRRLWRAVSVVARLGPRKFEKLYVDGSDVLDRRPMCRRSRRHRGLPPGLFLDEPRTRQRWRGPRTYQGVIRSRRAVQASRSV